jgi:hypothetical protein
MVVHMLRLDEDDVDDDTEEASKLSNDVLDDAKTPLSCCWTPALVDDGGGDDSWPSFASFNSPSCTAAASAAVVRVITGASVAQGYSCMEKDSMGGTGGKGDEENARPQLLLLLLLLLLPVMECVYRRRSSSSAADVVPLYPCSSSPRLPRAIVVVVPAVADDQAAAELLLLRLVEFCLPAAAMARAAAMAVAFMVSVVLMYSPLLLG